MGEAGGDLKVAPTGGGALARPQLEKARLGLARASLKAGLLIAKEKVEGLQFATRAWLPGTRAR